MMETRIGKCSLSEDFFKAVLNVRYRSFSEILGVRPTFLDVQSYQSSVPLFFNPRDCKCMGWVIFSVETEITF